jgi:hypothetical protein
VRAKLRAWERARETEVRDDRRDRPVSERKREHARAERAALLGRGRAAGPSASARAQASAWARGSLGWAGPE